MQGSSAAQRAHPITADAEVAVAQLDCLLRADDWLRLVPVVHLWGEATESMQCGWVGGMN